MILHQLAFGVVLRIYTLYTIVSFTLYSPTSKVIELNSILIWNTTYGILKERHHSRYEGTRYKGLSSLNSHTAQLRDSPCQPCLSLSANKDDMWRCFGDSLILSRGYCANVRVLRYRGCVCRSLHANFLRRRDLLQTSMIIEQLRIQTSPGFEAAVTFANLETPQRARRLSG